MQFRAWPFLLWLPLLGVLTACPAQVVEIDPKGPMQIWATGSLERIRPEAPSRPHQPLELFAARGETESFHTNLR